MITSASISYISQVLKEPQNISEADTESIEALKQSFPYFVPARYLDAALSHKQAPFNESMMADMRLYSGNWLLYATFLQNAIDGQEVEMTIAPPKKETPKAKEQPQAETQETIAEQPKEEIIEEPISVLEDTTTDDIDDGFDMGNTSFETGEQTQPEAIPTAQPTTTKNEQKENIKDKLREEQDEALILPVYTEDYFMHQGVNVSNNIPENYNAEPQAKQEDDEDEKSLMVVMSFSEWLSYFKTKKEAEEEEVEGQKALRTMWQKEKLAAALEEEDDEIPENVFEMAVNSISKEDGLISESLANIHIKQGRFDKAIDMYRKLSLRNPQKKAYFARRIEVLLKDKNS